MKRFSMGLILALMVGFLVGVSAPAAVADASSSWVTWRHSLSCFRHIAHSQNGGDYTKFGGGLHQVYGLTCSGAIYNGEHIGISAALKKTNGSACSVASPSYKQTGSMDRKASYSAAACGINVQLQGSVTSYAYVTSSYVSASISAPFQTYNP